MSSSALVVGAGVTGAAVARALATRGWRVTLAEQHSPGTVRSASGGDTRLLRAAHGGNDWYTALAWRARTQWLELQEETGVRVWEPTGFAWFAHAAGGFEERSLPGLERAGIPFEGLAPGNAKRLFPAVAVDDLYGVLYEPEAGVLHARRATQLLVEDGERRGVRRLATRFTPADTMPADIVVWACGPWLRWLFNFLRGTVERSEEFFLGGDRSWIGTPGWVDYDAGFYGHGDLAGLGVKIAPDLPTEQIDPETLDRLPSPEREREARAYAARRFPALAGTPLIGARVCQYDLTPDTHFVVARHPERESWWIVGGGSGHGFKHGPALGDYVADCVEGAREPEAFLGLSERMGNAGLRTGPR